MSKAFVIKNKEGKYPDDTQFQPFFTTKDICKTTLYKNFEEAQKARRSEFYKVVEITISEGDLEQENKQLKQSQKQSAVDKMTELYNLTDEIYHTNDMDKEWLLDWLKAEIWKLNQEIKSLKGEE